MYCGNQNSITSHVEVDCHNVKEMVSSCILLGAGEG